MTTLPDLEINANQERWQNWFNQELNFAAEDYSLLTDLYQLTMAACYIGEGVEQKPASFELFARKLPEGFGYLIAMGLAQALEYLEKLRFSPSQIQALQATGIFAHASDRFWSLLAEGSFTGDVWAVPEGTAVFANQPLLRVEAPLWQAQLVETYLLNTLNYQTLIATRAARIRDVAGEQATLLEFGTRRAFSPQGSLWAARAALAGGLDSTSNVLAALQLNQQPSGTMAHALVMALSAMAGSEEQAFTAFHRYFPGAPLLIDTYDTIAAAQHLAPKVNSQEMQLSGVRLDSGDLVSLSQKVRSLLPTVPIFASGDLDEWEIARLKAAGAQIDGYGLGTKLVTGAPVNGVYKLVEIDGIPVMKESRDKATYPGRKQIFRSFVGGMLQVDRLGLATETPLDAEPLLQLVMKQGKKMQSPESLATIRHRTAASVASLPEQTRRLNQPLSVNVEISAALQDLTQNTKKTAEAQR
ncbi:MULTISPECIES: nicotinate phosphoribosyltransferase [unclassified Tolypothrix]|uniref:nicotinate phosphoribosyltransferase n=1 Tax=unclassified Tolypothrix TaxID=2649714 RepID=UPI0005EAB886|nr:MULTISPECIES: nicotinate phosphoribosyltransferase [unclassified Tolypothrix]BAY90874.1 putative nicotinate phosphoribosyltransferase [Microchaete diplosiphon NIES-3275]EKE96596.1 putative nicotinate phosphoribosyltransferase [Tolypothrix sp. PCC 7601]MBE9082049.1 nicotinate phosphoribosyltransferase [Tolypothrix sp. LEGE 11397]UYD24998.1 nicotinate phosphoribosyltransferase [Tolypothrix sp. PCC 7712]UYD32766.1 nicotinate phosphoribosyltransferase [Tolypothrix sp. PCC 7601]